MSVIKHTSNLLLTLFETDAQLPTYLKYYTEDMLKIDNGFANHGQRLAVIEEVIATVSTQNINDIIARVDALEHKVEANSNQIHEINDNIGAIETRIGKDEEIIRDNTAKIVAVDGRVTVLEECCEEVRDTLNAHAVRIGKNETDISNILIRLERDESNISGNANDITILSAQVQTNAHNIDELTHALDDIDPSSTLELVRQVADNTNNIASLFSITGAQTNRIDGIITRLAGDEGRITDLERRMTSAEIALEQVGEWQTQIDNLSADVTQMQSDVGALTTLVNGYESRISTLETDDATFTAYMTSNDTRVGAVENRVTALENAGVEFDNRLDSLEDWKLLVDADRSTFSAYITSNDARVLAIETDIGAQDISIYGTTVKSAILEAFNRIATLTNKVGDLTTLHTVVKTSIVNAINEIVDDIANYKTLVEQSFDRVWIMLNTGVATVGNLELLDTTDKSNIVSAINEVNSLVVNVKEALFPIGCVYMTIGNTNPSTLLGFGTWSQLSDGYLRNGGASASGGSLTTGGHSLTVNEIPSHNHGIATLDGSFYVSSNVAVNSANAVTIVDTSGICSSQVSSAVQAWTPTDISSASDRANGVYISATHEHSLVGGNEAHSHTIEPTYTRIYAWERTA